jgi:hypothetical protein
MNPSALARNNHLFFYVDLTQNCLLTEAFTELCSIAARKAAFLAKHPGYSPIDDGTQQLPFKCQNGEFGYLRFTSEAAQILVEKRVQSFSLAMQVPRSIQGEFNERCEFALKDGVKMSFKIIDYEGDLGQGCIKIPNPVTDCPIDEIPLGRKVEMRVVYSSL